MPPNNYIKYLYGLSSAIRAAKKCF
jgi:hypothetical protein